MIFRGLSIILLFNGSLLIDSFGNIAEIEFMGFSNFVSWVELGSIIKLSLKFCKSSDNTFNKLKVLLLLVLLVLLFKLLFV